MNMAKAHTRYISDNVFSCVFVEKRKNFLKAQGWTTPRIQYLDVALPSLKMQLTSEKPTFNDLHRIRAKVLSSQSANIKFFSIFF